MKEMLLYYIYTLMINLKFTRVIMMIYMLNQGVTLIEFSIIQITYNLVKILSNFPTGVLADKIKRKYAISIGLALNGLVCLVIYGLSFYEVSNYFWVFMVLFAVNALGVSFLMESDQALLYDFLVKKNKQGDYVKSLGRKEAFGTLFLSLGAIITGYVSEVSMVIPFLMQGIACFFAILAIISFPEPEIKKRHEGDLLFTDIIKNGFKHTKGNHLLIFVLFFVAIVVASTDAIVMFTQGYFDSIGMSVKMIGYVYSASTLLSVLASLYSVKMKDYKFLTIISMVLGLYVLGILMMVSENLFLVAFGFLMIYITIDLIEPPMLGIINDETPSEIRATVLSMLGTIRNILSILLYIVYGVVGQVNGYKSMYFALGAIILGIFTVLYYYYFKVIAKREYEFENSN